MADLAQLTAPVSTNYDWQLRAECRGMDASIFYHPDNERGLSRRRREQQAKAICAACPVAQQCLEWALSIREPYGVWGGASPTEREEMLEDGSLRRSSRAS